MPTAKYLKLLFINQKLFKAKNCGQVAHYLLLFSLTYDVASTAVK
jgi:hypothetical protein